jgi:hypothetical protein
MAPARSRPRSIMAPSWCADAWTAGAHNLVQVLGAEARLDLTRRIDLGVNLSLRHAGKSGGTAYAIGPSIGVSPAENTWISVGWNAVGYHDPDFEAAGYSRKGFYVTARVKFDQTTFAGLLRRFAPMIPLALLLLAVTVNKTAAVVSDPMNKVPDPQGDPGRQGRLYDHGQQRHFGRAGPGQDHHHGRRPGQDQAVRGRHQSSWASGPVVFGSLLSNLTYGFTSLSSAS